MAITTYRIWEVTIVLGYMIYVLDNLYPPHAMWIMCFRMYKVSN